MKCSNYIGDAIDDGVRLKMDGLLLVGHIGKLVKIAAGVMNTHSRQADARMEVLAVHAAMAGADRETVCAPVSYTHLDVYKRQYINIQDRRNDQICSGK